MICMNYYQSFIIFFYSKTSSMWVFSDSSELLVWSSYWDKDTLFESYYGLLYNPSKHCPMSFCLLPCCFSFMPSLGCKYLEISLSILTLNTIVMSTSIRLEQEFSSCLGTWFFFFKFQSTIDSSVFRKKQNKLRKIRLHWNVLSTHIERNSLSVLSIHLSLHLFVSFSKWIILHKK